MSNYQPSLKALYLVSTPVGNPDDFSPRAKQVLQDSDTILVEERKPAYVLFKQQGIDVEEKTIIQLNEHNEREKASDLAQELLMTAKQVSLISDAGMPLMADPGNYFVQNLIQFDVPLKHVPGAHAPTAALQLSGFNTTRYYYSGFLPRADKMRENALRRLKSIDAPVIIMETPYRLQALLKHCQKLLGPGRPASISFDISMESEQTLRLPLRELHKRFENKGKNRRNFVLVVDLSGRN